MAFDTEPPLTDQTWVPLHRRPVLIDVAQRMLALHQAGTTTLTDEVMDRSVDIYASPDRLEVEREVMFRSTPIVAAFSGQVPGPGDHLALDLAGLAVLVVRHDDGRVRALLNSCRHRGAPVADGAGCAKRFTCQYHGWTYDTDGTLVSLPGAEGFKGMDRSERGLIELPCEERDGVVWVLPDPDGTLDLDASLGALLPELAELSIDRLVHLGTDRHDLACNWHVALDTATESYHFLQLHWASIGDAAMANLNVVDWFGTGQRVAYAGTNLVDLAGIDTEAWIPQDCIQFVYLLYPNTAVVVTSTYVVGLMQVFPADEVGRCTMVLSSFTRDLSPSDLDPIERHRGFWSVVVGEDLPMAEAIQRSMGSSSHSTMVFGRNEPGLQGLHRLYDQATPTVS